MVDRYKEALRLDKEASERYYTSSLKDKTEQQKRLEELLEPLKLCPTKIADIACGAGGSSYHLSRLYPEASYTLVDINEDAIELARAATQTLRSDCLVADIYDLPLETDGFDLVVCWQTLSWIDEPKRALQELVRICRPGARVFASALFNLRHDVDVYARVVDHTRPSSAEALDYVYNTYSLASIRKWIGGLVSGVRIYEFELPIDLTCAKRGLGTYTVRLENGNRLQLSAGMLLNWGILELRK